VTWDAASRALAQGYVESMVSFQHRSLTQAAGGRKRGVFGQLIEDNFAIHA